MKGIDLMLAAMAALPADSELRLVLGGPEPEPGFVERLKARPGGDRIDFIGWVSPAELPSCYAQAIGTFVLYPPMPNNVESEPVKLFESMAAGVPVIMSDFPLFRSFVERWDCGFALDAADAHAVAATAVKLERDRALAQRMGNNGLAAARSERSWERAAVDLRAMYRTVIGSNDPSA